MFVLTAGYAQQLDYGLDFRVRFDNREYKSEFSDDKTLFGLKLVPEAGVKWGAGRLMAGVDLTRHFGAKGEDQPDPELILYYGYDNKRNFKAYAGVFQRDKMVRYPRVILSGSKNFYDPNIEGAMFRYYGGKGYAEVACDWNSMITDTQYERFVLFWAGNIALKQFEGSRLSVGGYGSMHHFAGSEQDRGVVDNVLFYPYVEYHFNIGGRPEWRWLATVYRSFVRAGWVQALQNDRENVDEYVTPNGFMAEAQLEWNGIGVYNTLYLGDNLMPYYSRFGGALYLGDQFFRTHHGVYNRLEIYWQPRLKDGLSLKVSSVHHYDGARWDWQQLVSFSVALDRKK